MPPRPSMRELDGYPGIRYRAAAWPDELELVRGVFRDYRQWIVEHGDAGAEDGARVKAGIAMLDAQSENIERNYGPPRGEILLFYQDADLVACGGIREFEPEIGEMARLYIRPDFRGEEFGKPFVLAHLERSRELGYRRIRSYALESMFAALDFYQELGFQKVPAYWPHPASRTVFFERNLEA